MVLFVQDLRDLPIDVKTGLYIFIYFYPRRVQNNMEQASSSSRSRSRTPEQAIAPTCPLSVVEPSRPLLRHHFSEVRSAAGFVRKATKLQKLSP